MSALVNALDRLAVGIDGFDAIADGGLPLGRTTLVAGTAGSGKTLFGVQFLVSGVERFDQNGVIVTFEEAPRALQQNVLSIGWDLPKHVRDNRIAIVDVSPEPEGATIEAGHFDLTALMARIEHAVNRVNAKRVLLDALGAVFPQLSDNVVIRRELHRIAVGLRRLGVTALMTVERSDEYGAIARFGVEEFVADNVIVMRNQLEAERRRRTIEVLKFRGASHRKGEFSFTIGAPDGITVVPLSSIGSNQPPSGDRVSTGNGELDDMCGGGIFENSIALVSGATGTGKTLMVAEFVKAAVQSRERALLFAFEESRDQLIRNAASWGVDYERAERLGLLRIVCRHPESIGLEDHLVAIKQETEAFGPQRLAIDSMSALERGTSAKAFREFVIGITGHVKAKGMAAMFTNTTAMLVGRETIAETHMSTVTDSIFLLRYVELCGEVRRGIAVLKMRGSQHDRDIREYSIGANGMTIRGPFESVNGILAGAPTRGRITEHDRLSTMFAHSYA
ncbi:MAG: circadian clock protein KaiC [Pseudomonadota bacterium]